MADIHAIIMALYAERERIERAIANLEKRANASIPRNRQNRGRKSMPPEERREVSRRMTAYWARRKMVLSKPTPGNGSAGYA